MTRDLALPKKELLSEMSWCQKGEKESSEERSRRRRGVVVIFFYFIKKERCFVRKELLSEIVRKEERSQKGGKESERRKGVRKEERSCRNFFLFYRRGALFCQKGVVVGNKELLSERSCQKGMFKRKVLDPGVGCWLMVDVDG